MNIWKNDLKTFFKRNDKKVNFWIFRFSAHLEVRGGGGEETEEGGLRAVRSEEDRGGRATDCSLSPDRLHEQLRVYRIIITLLLPCPCPLRWTFLRTPG
jgi:hypothetical protein